jgi:hypothetical protein
LESGLFRLGDNTKVTKYYDYSTDRLKFIIDKYDAQGTQKLPTFLHTFQMNLDGGVAQLPVSSADYNIPITNKEYPLDTSEYIPDINPISTCHYIYNTMIKIICRNIKFVIKLL